MARRSFSFLEIAGFCAEELDSNHLRYRSVRSVVEVHWIARSGDVEVFFGLPATPSTQEE